ncbi:ABC transporter ATP-binding protein [Aureimonas phyllosphaerae]|uniref:ATP-binding cassette subfamily B protein/ATP-binding cassette subfamily B multidrug efflux pump n=1 Tax=Aureimonas phyllosphaerae TaxID=1166078 RepID=A0A7W6BT22_9HYPH|nr:ABC transporter ATP-binding protein [Aureimonas phyllosphaerae]MBB3935810.1 ATP-binding cassette subfamily B protein/ATP-binding cassette subfamily B multidrug efflux pump [Aureimonas phyllosphaerae]MBB3959818.1 ATP-binding cassette subfamily B protein/ATP-binding cassette subfamily B multidrug efflux pump [Aureimonas phyllosphaerae]SFF15364.1 ATP-binding cassette, subfamily B/ATP-binding cassette, subfamily B, multidrug efflux pump [Aureimonas phyllosphaerae]
MIGGLLRRFERIIDPYGDVEPDGAEPRRVGALPPLPQETNRFIWHFASEARWPFLALLVTGGLTGGVDAFLYAAVGRVVDALGSSSPATLLADHFWLLVTLAVTTLLLRTLVLFAASLLEQQVIVPSLYNRIRWQSYRRLMDQSYTFFQNDFAGRIAQKVQQVGEATGDFIVTTLQTFWSFITFTLLAVAILGAMDPWMGLVLFLWAIGYGWIVRDLLPRIRRAGRESAEARSVMSGRIVDSFTNILAVELFDPGRRQDTFVLDGFRRFVEAIRALTRAITAVRTAVAVLNGLMMTAIGALVLHSWMQNTASTGDVATALGLILRLNQMSGWMMFNINGLVRNYGTVQDAVGIVSKPPALLDRADAPALQPAGGAVEYRDVTFHYGKGKGVIGNFSLEIRPGEKVGLVGRSGAGKTTLVNLLLRLYDVERGSILIDGQDISGVTQTSLRREIGVVTQDTSLFHRSIRDNIAYGRPDASEEEILSAARRADALGFIRTVRDPNGREGLDAFVGERGVKLSGGQRQRIAIARVFLKNAPILVLDEATSALDSEVEVAIQDNLGEMMQGKTVIAIAHRLSTIARLDRLVVIDAGRIVEEGTHADLVRRGGLYASLWARQSGGFLPAAAE